MMTMFVCSDDDGCLQMMMSSLLTLDCFLDSGCSACGFK